MAAILSRGGGGGGGGGGDELTLQYHRFLSSLQYENT